MIGHVFGIQHEPPSKEVVDQLDREKVNSYFSASPYGWTKDEIEENIFFNSPTIKESTTTSKRQSPVQHDGSSIDKSSIMQYQFPCWLFKDGKGTMRLLTKDYLSQMSFFFL